MSGRKGKSLSAPESGKSVEEVLLLRRSFPSSYATASSSISPARRLRESAEGPDRRRDALRTAQKYREVLGEDPLPEGMGEAGMDFAADDWAQPPQPQQALGSSAPTDLQSVLQQVSVAEVVASNPVRVAYEELKEKYSVLVARVQDLEHVLTQQQKKVQHLERERQLAEDAKVEPPAHIGFRFNQLETVVDRLGTVFMDRDALIKRQWLAANVINTVVRGFLTRRRFQRGRRALSRWWGRAGLPFFRMVEEHSTYVEELQEKETQVKTNRTQRQVQKIFKRWRRVAIHSRPENEDKMRGVMMMIMVRNEQLLRAVFTSWRRCAHGVGSRKNVARNYKLRLAQARAKIKASGKVDGIIIKETLQKEMHRDATKRIKERHLVYMVRYCFYCWHDISVNRNHFFTRRALRHYFQRAAKQCFDAWKRFVKMTTDQGAAWRIESRDAFRPRINVRAVRQFRRRQLLGRCLRALHRYCHPRAVVLRHVEATATMICTRTIRAWRAQTEWSLAAKRLCVAEWKDYSRRLCSAPFHAWYLWVSQRRSKLHGQQILISAFHRRQRTHKMYQIFKLWKHLSVYGKLEGTKSRQALIKALDEQNKFAESLEATVDALQDDMALLTKSLHDQENINHDQIAEQQLLHSQLEQYKFALHAAETEIARLQALQDSLAKCYPSTVAKLKQAQEIFFIKQKEKNMADGKRQIGDDAPEMETYSRKRAVDLLGSASAMSVKRADKIIKNPEKALASKQKSKRGDPSVDADVDKPAGDDKANTSATSTSAEDAAILRRAKLVLERFGSGRLAAQVPDGVEKSDEEQVAVLESRILSFLATGLASSGEDQPISATGQGTTAAGAGHEAAQQEEQEVTPSRAPSPTWQLDAMTERQNWNEVLQEFELLYPMQHPINKTAKSAIQTRIARAKSASRDNYNTHVNMFASEEEVPD